MKYNKAFKYRVYPNNQQEKLIHKTFGCARFVYNQILGKAKEIYEIEKKNKIITPATLKKEFEFLKEVDSLALANAQLNVRTSFTNFFKKRAKFPKFKSKKNSRKSYTTNNVNNSIRVENKKLKLPKLGLVKIKLHRPISENYKIKAVTLSQEPNGAYYVSILTEFEADIKPVPVDKNIVGLDFSMKELFVSSDNQRADYPRFFRKLESKLAKEQRVLSRRKRGSNNWYKQKKKVASVHQKVKNCRKDFLHKLSTELIENYNAISIEDLNMQGMSKALNFGKSVSDNGWGLFTSMLKYKATFAGKTIVKIDKWFPSSKACSCCGEVKVDLKLSDRIFNCSCGYIADRDYNASINIKNEGLAILGV
jgi:putative transposase